MKKLLMILCASLCLCACQKTKEAEITETALSYKDIDYNITKLTTLKNEGSYMPVLSGCQGDTLYGMVQNGDEFVVSYKTKKFFTIENGKMKSFPFQKETVISNHLMIDKQLYYISQPSVEKKSTLYKYKDGKNDEIIGKLQDYTSLVLLPYDSAFLVAVLKQDSLEINRYSDQGLTQLSTIELEKDLNGITYLGAYQDDFLIITYKDKVKTLYAFDINTGKEKYQLTDIEFDRYVVTDNEVVLYSGKKENVYNRKLELQQTYQTPESNMIGVTYNANGNYGVLIDSMHNIYLRTYKDNIGYKIDAEQDPLLKQLTIILATENSLIAMDLENTVYEISFDLPK